jgi:macrolide transport system ATP-binding/permease protein
VVLVSFRSRSGCGVSEISFLQASGLVKSYGGRRILGGVSFIASPGQRVGLVGENGVGKSTLLRLLAGVDEPDSGSVSRPDDCGFLWQELPFQMDARVQDILDDALSEIRRAKHTLNELSAQMAGGPDDAELLAEYGELLEWAQDHGLWDADRRAAVVLAGLGLSLPDTSRRLGSLSGGQRRRLGIAALLIRQPGTLLLDEPTNHLDDEALEFLEQQLSDLPGIVVVASHDRVFLDQVCTHIVDLDPHADGGTTRHGGAYSDYLEAKRLERSRWEQQYEAEQDELAELRHAVAVTARSVNHARAMRDGNKMAYARHGGRVQRQISRRVRNAQHRLDELDRDQVRKPPEPLRFNAALTGNTPTGQIAVSLRAARFSDRLAVDHLDIDSKARLMVTGPNGAGKSTLLKLVAGRLTPDSGEVLRARGLQIALLEQDTAFSDSQQSPRRLYELAGGDRTTPLAHLGLLSPRDLDRPVGRLSTGQQRRFALALLLVRPPGVLLLDEPTNHLSLALVEEMEEALESAPGAIVVATHDRWLRRNWNGTAISVIDGRVTT